MRNRAKCKLCGDVIESFHLSDYVYCKCNEIGISGGNIKYHVSAKNFENFLRIDDEGNVIEVIVKELDENVQHSADKEIQNVPTREDMLEMLDEMRKKIESLPIDAMYAPVSHADFASLMMLLLAIFRSESEEKA